MQADAWAFGVILWEIGAREKPYKNMVRERLTAFTCVFAAFLCL